ncbi:MAG: tetratricopeptide repeat protein [Caldilineaceae bacterium]
MGHYGDAVTAAQAAVALAEAVHADDLLALGNLAWGVALGRENAFAAARERLEVAVRLAEAANLPQIAADGLRNLGIDAAYQNQSDLAKRYFAESLAIYRQQLDRPAEAAGLGNLAVLALRSGDYQGAGPYLTEALVIFREIGDLRNATITRSNLGSIAHKLGNDAEAEQHFTQALSITAQTDDQQSRREAHSLLGHLLSDQARNAEAQAHYTAALSLAQALNVPGHVVEAQVGLAALALAAGDAAGAYQSLNPVLAAIDESTLAQADDALRIYWRTYQILIANHDAQADTMLATAHQQLQRLAAQLTDKALQQTFLQDVPLHRLIMNAFVARGSVDDQSSVAVDRQIYS